MAGEAGASDRMHYAIGPVEHRLTEHLERAHQLAERAQSSKDAAQYQIERAAAIARELCARMRQP